MKFGEKLRALRKERGLTQAELAQRAGLGLKTIANYESGATYPQNREVYAALAKVLETSADYLQNEYEDFSALLREEIQGFAALAEEHGLNGGAAADRLLEAAICQLNGQEVEEEEEDEEMNWVILKMLARYWMETLDEIREAMDRQDVEKQRKKLDFLEEQFKGLVES